MDGKRDAVLVVGAEAERSKRRAKRADHPLEWTQQEGPAPENEFGGFAMDVTRHEVEMGLRRPAEIFSLYENAMRAARGESLDAHRERISALWARFAAVAADNPYAWSREAPSAATIRSVTPDNAMIA